MRGLLTIIQVGGAVSSQELTAPPALEALQGGVGGDIEIVPYFTRYDGKPCVAFCNEHGKLHLNLRVNSRASALWYAQEPRFLGRDILVGPIVIVTGDKQLMREL
jgi:hypothetical protein